jgi:hypothetical protein
LLSWISSLFTFDRKRSFLPISIAIVIPQRHLLNISGLRQYFDEEIIRNG